jgi:hypothetical protein
MHQYLKEAKIGILNMKETYSTCIQTMARLDTILDKIDLVCVGQEKIDATTQDQLQITNNNKSNGKQQQHN